MIPRKFLVAAALVAALPVAAASAQAGLRAGATVTDVQGGVVGTIASVDGEFVVLRTDRHEARVPVSSLTATDQAVLFGLTRDQLNTQIDQAVAQAQQAVAVGAVVHDRDGAVVGPVEALDAETLTVKLGEQLIRLPRSAVAPGENGLVIGATLAELQAQVGGAAASAGN
jgi:preprotein translocase subunit YajC